MAQATLVKEVLSKDRIDAGAKLIARLKNSGWPVTAAFWFYISEEDLWRLTIASSNAASEGPRKAYQRVQIALAEEPSLSQEIELQDIAVIDASHSLAQRLSRVLPAGSQASDVRLSNSAVEGTLIEGAYVYHLA